MPRRSIGGYLIVSALGAAVGFLAKRQRSPTRPVGPQDADTERAQQEPQGHHPPGAAHHAPHQGWHPEESRHHRYERRYWWFSSALTFIAAAGAVWSVILSQQSLRESRNAVTEAKRQADVSERQLSSDRPYIFIEPEVPDTMSWRLGLGIFNFSFHFSNFGKSPAIIKFVNAGASITDQIPDFNQNGTIDFVGTKPMLENFIHINDMNISVGTVILAGGNGITYTVSGDQVPLKMDGLPPNVANKRALELMNSVQGGPIKFWLVGKVVYADVDGRDYVTNFCMRVSDNHNSVIGDGLGLCNARD